MPSSKKNQPQTFNDGVANIYTVCNIAPPGGMPKEGLKYKIGPLRYRERTVGISRFWAAVQMQARIDAVLRMSQIRSVSLHDVVIPIDGQQYKIVQIQYPEDIYPPVMDLSLQRLEVAYDTE